MGPAPDQTRRQVLQARQFDLQLAFMAARALGKNLENQQGAVVDRQAEHPLQIALLGRAQGLVKQDFAGAGLQRKHLDLVGLAAANEQRGIRRPALADHTGNRLQAGRLGQQAQLFQAGIKIGEAQIDPDQNGQRRRRRGEVLGTQLAGLSWDSDAAKVTARPGTMVEMACL